MSKTPRTDAFEFSVLTGGYAFPDQLAKVAVELCRELEMAAATYWMPIETAPKDGQEILLWVVMSSPMSPDNFSQCMLMGHWNTPQWDGDEEGWSYVLDEGIRCTTNITAALWMPLPNTPQ